MSRGLMGLTIFGNYCNAWRVFSLDSWHQDLLDLIELMTEVLDLENWTNNWLSYGGWYTPMVKIMRANTVCCSQLRRALPKFEWFFSCSAWWLSKNQLNLSNWIVSWNISYQSNAYSETAFRKLYKPPKCFTTILGLWLHRTNSHAICLISEWDNWN